MQLIPELSDCRSTFPGEILQFEPRGGSAARLRDLLIVLVLLDLISCNGGKQCHGTVLQVDYSFELITVRQLWRDTLSTGSFTK